MCLCLPSPLHITLNSLRPAVTTRASPQTRQGILSRPPTSHAQTQCTSTVARAHYKAALSAGHHARAMPPPPRPRSCHLMIHWPLRMRGLGLHIHRIQGRKCDGAEWDSRHRRSSFRRCKRSERLGLWRGWLRGDAAKAETRRMLSPVCDCYTAPDPGSGAVSPSHTGLVEWLTGSIFNLPPPLHTHTYEILTHHTAIR